MKYVGMSSKPYTRKAQWGKDRHVRNFEIVESGLSYKEAQELENQLLAECEKCPYCESRGHAGGRPVPGDSYSVYTYDY